jgi:hypothetical protein
MTRRRVIRGVFGVVALVAAPIVMAMSTAHEARAFGVPEIPAPWLDDIAVARMTTQGPVIYYNPTLCKEVGAGVCSFFRAHEYGHITLNHAGAFYTKYFGGRALAEAEADCFAAKNALRWQVKAAVAWFLMPDRIDWDPGEHGTGRVRAKRLKECGGL